jgi:hypothetical protein
MSLTSIISSPKLPLWLIRLIADPSVLSQANADPLLFASWYAMGSELVTWPDEAKAIQEKERAKKLTLERSLDLLDKLNRGSDFEKTSTEQVRRLLEGYAVYDWVSLNRAEFKELVSAQAQALSQVFEGPYGFGSEFSLRIDEFSKVLGLSEVEAKVLTLAFMCAAVPPFKAFLLRLVQPRQSNVAQLWGAMLACTPEELRQAFSATGVLRTSRILQAQGSTFKLPSISEFWVNVLATPLEPVFDSLLKPLTATPGSGIPARLSEEDQTLAVSILSQGAKTGVKGVNLLLYGADVFEKRGLLADVLAHADKKGFVLKDFENSWGELPCIAYVAQRFLFHRYGSDAVLILEKPGDVLEHKPSEFLRSMFGIELDSSHIAPLDQLILDTNPAPTLWAGPGADNLQEECIARFVFHAPLKKARREERRAQLEQYVAGLSLNKATKQELLTLEDVSARQLETAMVAAKLSGATTKKEREAALVHAIRRSLAALKRDTSAKAKECVTEYSLDYINYAGKFGPEQLLKALKLRPKGSLCLYGPPGTGKTQFVEHLAQQLGIRLISKRASVGENEKHISNMFQEAESEEAILFLDEGDSFLQDRNNAHQSWEVSRVNELLQGMERFKGIFVVATNLFQGLDTAALRRFTFKLEFRALKAEHRWDMFLAETGLKLGEHTKAEKDSWRGDLLQMHQLSAGDFATVQRQCVLLGEELTPAQWVEQLQLECDVKTGAPAPAERESVAPVPKPPRQVH